MDPFGDPFGDPFADAPAPVKAKPAAAAAAKPAAAAAAAAVPAAAPKAAAKAALDDPFAMDDPFSAPAATATATKPAPPAAAPAPVPVAVAAKTPVAKPAAALSDPFAMDDDPFAVPAGASSSSFAAKHAAAKPPSPTPVAPAPVVAAAAVVEPVAEAVVEPVAEPAAEPARVPTSEPEPVSVPEPEPVVVAAAEPDVESETEAEPVVEEPVPLTSAAAADALFADNDVAPASGPESVMEPEAAAHAEEDAAEAEAAAAAGPASVEAVSAALAATGLEQYVPDEDDAEDELTLVDQELTALPAELIRTRGMQLRRIDLSQNKLTSLASLAWPYGKPDWPALAELILDKNQLTSLAGMAPIPTLTTLWLNNNLIDDLELLLDQIEKIAPSLRYLSMLRNPAAPDSYFGSSDATSPSSSSGGDSGMESYHRFRLYVCYRLKNLQFLDATPVGPEERKEATLRGAYCRVAKPQAPKPLKGAAADTGATGSASNPLSPDRQSTVGLTKDAKPPKVATFLAKGKPRYDGTNSEGNRFIMNDDL